jgi:hypothetical protein
LFGENSGKENYGEKYGRGSENIIFFNVLKGQTIAI